MSRLFVRAVLVSSLMATAACTQEPARIDNHSQNYFGRDGAKQTADAPAISYRGSKYASMASKTPAGYKPYQPAPVYTNVTARETPVRNVPLATEKNASVQSIGISDLPPPTATPAKTKPQSSGLSEKPANRWTEKERDDSKIAPEKPAKITAADKTSSKFMWPVADHKVISGFGPKGAGKVNDGMNIASAEGEPVWASADGEVVYAGNELKGYGNMVLIKHNGNKTTSYAHLNRATVDKYDRVKQGDIIGYVGSTGNVKSPQLHFAIRDGKDPVDPKKYLSTNVAGL